MRRITVPLILQSLVFLLPISYYINGTGTVNGIQWVLVRYQQDIFGNYFSSILYTNSRIILGDFLGLRALSAVLWDIGAVLLMVCFAIQVFSILKNNTAVRKYAAIITIMSGLFFLISLIIQYGVLLSGPNGFCIPFGIPVLLGIGWYTWRYQKPSELPYQESPESSRSRIINELVLIIFVSLIVKIIVFSVSMYALIMWKNLDIDLYYNYLHSALSGKIPYIDYTIEYPQFFFIPVAIAAIPSLVLHNSAVYHPSFMILMHIIDAGILVTVYFIALRLYGQDKAVLCSILYATAFSSAFFVAITYDSFPTFLLVISVLFFLYGKEIPAYISATIGAMSKWFPALSMPYYLLYTIKNRKPIESLKKGLIISSVIVCLGILPFILINYRDFLQTYLYHVDRTAYYRSLIYYLDSVSHYYFNSEPFVILSLVFLAVAELILLYWYYKYLDGKESTLCYIIFLSIFWFILVNKIFGPYYTVWIMPFLALFLINSLRHLVLFYILQLIMFIESPIMLELVIREYSFDSFISHPDLFHPFVFYTVKFLLFFIIIYVIIRDMSREHSVRNIRGE